jgi:hypothetical protein
MKIAEGTNRERKTKNDETSQTPSIMRICAYTLVNEGNAFKFDSENPDEIVKGERS